MSRQRLRPGVLEGSTSPCQHCQGTGIIRSTNSIALSVIRSLEDALMSGEQGNLNALTPVDVSLYILNEKRQDIIDMEQRYGVSLQIVGTERLHGANYSIERAGAGTSSGNVLMQVTRPAKFMKSRVIIQDGLGNDIGEVAQENVFGKIRFSYNANGRRIGGIQAENWRAWNFSLLDAADNEVARITKTFEGVAKTLFTTADNYVLQVHKPLEEPLRSLVVASALTVDTALKQDNRGLG